MVTAVDGVSGRDPADALQQAIDRLYPMDGSSPFRMKNKHAKLEPLLAVSFTNDHEHHRDSFSKLMQTLREHLEGDIKKVCIYLSIYLCSQSVFDV